MPQTFCPADSIEIKGLQINVTMKRSTASQRRWSTETMQRLSEQTASSASDGSRCQLALLHGLLEPLSKHLQVRIPHQEGERWEPLLWINKNKRWLFSPLNSGCLRKDCGSWVKYPCTFLSGQSRETPPLRKWNLHTFAQGAQGLRWREVRWVAKLWSELYTWSPRSL